MMMMMMPAVSPRSGVMLIILAGVILLCTTRNGRALKPMDLHVHAPFWQGKCYRWECSVIPAFCLLTFNNNALGKVWREDIDQ